MSHFPPSFVTIRFTRVQKSTMLLQNTLASEDGCPDMVSLNYLHEPAILFNLKHRFFKRIPYTYTGAICIAVNPVRLPLLSLCGFERGVRRNRSCLSNTLCCMHPFSFAIPLVAAVHMAQYLYEGAPGAIRGP